MLKKIESLIKKNPDRKSFFVIIGHYFPKYSSEYILIQNAYDLAKKVFRSKNRETGERYFEHLRSVALILILYLRVRDPNIIVAALLHDIIEDIDGWNQVEVATMFNIEVSQLVWWVTKPNVVDFDNDKEKRNREYHRRLSTAPRNAVLIKLADRLHNMTTSWASTKVKQRRTVRDTQDFYLPLAELHTVLIHELETAISSVIDSWKNSSK